MRPKKWSIGLFHTSIVVYYQVWVMTRKWFFCRSRPTHASRMTCILVIFAYRCSGAGSAQAFHSTQMKQNIPLFNISATRGQCETHKLTWHKYFSPSNLQLNKICSEVMTFSLTGNSISALHYWVPWDQKEEGQCSKWVKIGEIQRVLVRNICVNLTGWVPEWPVIPILIGVNQDARIWSDAGTSI